MNNLPTSTPEVAFTLPDWLSQDDFRCPECGGHLASQAGFRGLVCTDCQHNYRANVDGILEFLDWSQLNAFERGESEFHTEISDHAEEAHGHNTLRNLYLHNGFLKPILQLAPDSLLLDLACGSGVDVITLARAGYHVIGVDISAGMLATTQRKVDALGLTKNVFLCVANATALPFRPDLFAGSYICAGLHHMQEPEMVLRQLRQVTRPGGPVSIGSEPNAWIYRFRSVKHSRLGRRIMRLFRNDYTIGEQPPGDRETPGWSYKDWPVIIRKAGLHAVDIRPIWYLNGFASLLGMHALPRWFETFLCGTDEFLTRVPVVRRFSFKWNVIASKTGGQAT